MNWQKEDTRLFSLNYSAVKSEGEFNKIPFLCGANQNILGLTIFVS